LVATFASYLIDEELLPFRTSPITGRSIVELVTKRSAGGAGAIVGWFAVSTDHPLLILVVPAAIIVGGAATGVARGLEEGLHQRVLELVAPNRSEGGHLGEENEGEGDVDEKFPG
jgi:hypothetical protein